MNSIIYREIEPLEIAAVAPLAREVFDQFVAPDYQPDGVSEFYRYASAAALSQRHESNLSPWLPSTRASWSACCTCASLVTSRCCLCAVRSTIEASAANGLLQLVRSLMTRTASLPLIRHRMPFLRTNIWVFTPSAPSSVPTASVSSPCENRGGVSDAMGDGDAVKRRDPDDKITSLREPK